MSSDSYLTSPPEDIVSTAKGLDEHTKVIPEPDKQDIYDRIVGIKLSGTNLTDQEIADVLNDTPGFSFYTPSPITAEKVSEIHRLSMHLRHNPIIPLVIMAVKTVADWEDALERQPGNKNRRDIAMSNIKSDLEGKLPPLCDHEARQRRYFSGLSQEQVEEQVATQNRERTRQTRGAAVGEGENLEF